MDIKLMYFDECPSWQTAFENLKQVLLSEQISDAVILVKIENDERAQQEKFLGSPSIWIDGQDLWTEERESYSLSCRVYATPNGVKGFPTFQMLRSKIQTMAKA
jgi:hypothetical protein